ncbi:hypothetical protein CSB62_23780 [Vibrio splendidus]|uniref:Chromosome partitioning protein ParA n=1 Tax=Vibrio lentus TaxID=136468 RepID=A0A855ISL8_9VIBR|nr:hypothetical protein [Vibrio lentus]PHN83516.1 hypothetical protein CSB62_23780 [Vibrio splendidus]MCB5362009.1 hypothetical protein [Vibrio lentus]MCB5452344.1 hypothetical protein [Vibrio lentus]MCB5464377.1 hypothetical protein [Vibrio lentus]MCB5464513.1 hypothetical protein [Vibrio lentus]
MMELVDLLNSKDTNDSVTSGFQSLLVFDLDGFQCFVEEAFRFEGFDIPLSLSLGDPDIEYKLANAREKFLILDLTGSEDLQSDVSAMSHIIPTDMNVLVVGVEDKMSVERDMRTLGYHYTFWSTDKLSFIESVKLAKLSQQGNTEPSRYRQAKRIALLGTRGGVGTTTLSALLAQCLSDSHNSHCVIVDQNTFGDHFDVVLGAKHAGKKELAFDSIGTVMDASAAMSLTQKINSRLSLLAMQSSELSALEMKGYFRELYPQIGTACHFIIEDATQGLVAREDLRFYAKEIDILVLVIEPSFESLRQASKVQAILQEEKSRVRLLTVVNYSKPNNAYAVSLKEIESVLRTSVDVCVPFEPRLAQVLMDKGNILSQTWPLTDSVISLVHSVLGIKQVVKSPKFSLKKLLHRNQ